MTYLLDSRGVRREIAVERATDFDTDGKEHAVLLVLVDGRYICEVSDNEVGRWHVKETFGVEVEQDLSTIAQIGELEMDDDTKQKVAKLPVWARDLIQRLENQATPNLDEIVRLRRRETELEKINRRQHARIDAMVDMFQCAAKGGNEVAMAVAQIVDTWIVDYDE